MSIVWLEESVVLALHEKHLAEHGGPTGVRDVGLLQSALARPRNLAAYADPDISLLSQPAMDSVSPAIIPSWMVTSEQPLW